MTRYPPFLEGHLVSLSRLTLDRAEDKISSRIGDQRHRGRSLIRHYSTFQCSHSKAIQRAVYLSCRSSGGVVS